MRARPYDEATVESWRTEPRLSNLIGPDDFESVDEGTSPALWKDLALAAVVAVLFWFVAAGVVG